MNVFAMRDAAQKAALYVRAWARDCGLDSEPVLSTAVILGTGWGETIRPFINFSIPLRKIPGFEHLDALPEVPGHELALECCALSEKRFLALRGRIHLNEAPADQELHKMVRLQVEMLIHLGVRNLILTCGAGSLPGSGHPAGTIGVIDGFVSTFAPEMPLWAGEFCSPDDVLDRHLMDVALEAGREDPLIGVGGYAMVRGPQFEGRKYDKAVIASSGAKFVGMSMYPEACIASLYPGVRVLALAFVTNDDREVHDHATNQQRGAENALRLGMLLRGVLAAIDN